MNKVNEKYKEAMVDLDLESYFKYGVKFKQTTLINGKLTRGQGKTFILNKIAEEKGVNTINRRSDCNTVNSPSFLNKDVIIVDDICIKDIIEFVKMGKIVIGSYWD